jgi:hypothetical protein
LGFGVACSAGVIDLFGVCADLAGIMAVNQPALRRALGRTRRRALHSDVGHYGTAAVSARRARHDTFSDPKAPWTPDRNPNYPATSGKNGPKRPKIHDTLTKVRESVM